MSSDALGVARSNLVEQLRRRDRPRRGPYVRAAEADAARLEQPAPQLAHRGVGLGAQMRQQRSLMPGQHCLALRAAGVVAPVEARRSSTLKTWEMITLKSGAASRTRSPPSSAASTRLRKSCEYARPDRQLIIASGFSSGGR
jgi:hypothetical protein